MIEGMSTVALAFLASLVAGSFTGVGALPVMFTTGISQRTQAALLGFGAGVMLAATSFSLILPAIVALVAANFPSGENAASRRVLRLLIMVVPPGYDSLSEWMLQQLHFLREDQLAAGALFMLLPTLAIAAFVAWCLARARGKKNSRLIRS